MANSIERMIADTFMEMAQGLETGSFGKRPKIALTGMGSEHGEENSMAAAVAAARDGIDVYYIGTLEAEGVTTVKVANDEEGHDKMEEMLKNKYSLGGEQSGHIIFSEYAKTGDGILTAVQLLCAMIKNNKPLSELGAMMVKYPQVLMNVRVADKNGWQDKAAIQDIIKKYQTELGDNGQILVRASGTEPLIRIMAEGPEQSRLEKIASAIADVVTRELA